MDTFDPHVPHSAERSRAPAPAPRAVKGPSDEEIIRRIEASPAWADFCTCLIGTHPSLVMQAKKKKCCTVCDACGCRVKIHYEKKHREKCFAYRQGLP